MRGSERTSRSAVGRQRYRSVGSRGSRYSEICLANVGGDWKVYAEAGEQIVAEAASVQERADTPENMPPKFRSGSFCWWVWLIVTGFE